MQLTAGPAVSFVHAKGTSAAYLPAVLPCARLSYSRPFTDRLSFKTGIGYELKGWQTHQIYPRDEESRYEYHSRLRYHFLSVPLQLAYRIGEWGGHRLSVSGGMSYGFLFRARYQLTEEVYKGEERQSASAYEVKLPIRLDPSTSPITDIPHHSSLHAFNPAVRVEATWQWRQRYVLSAFYESNLYDVNASPSHGTSLYLQYCGLSAGISLP